jgi:hypothetical protein
MADQFFELSERDREEALEVVAARCGRPTHLLEKDVWVVWLLSVLFESPFASTLTFKGGTSLSKVYRVIDRFSEDIDLTYDIRELVPESLKGDDALPSTNSQAQKWTKAVRKSLPIWIDTAVAPLVREALTRARLTATVSRDEALAERLLVDYAPLRRGTGYVSPRVVLDFGARSTGEPHEIRNVTCDMAEHIPGVLFPEARPQVLKIARTFWEKATAAHVYCLQDKNRGERFSRHWHDLAAIAATEQFGAIANDREVAEAVAEHKSWFFVEKDADGAVIDYRAAVRGHLKIVPRWRGASSIGRGLHEDERGSRVAPRSGALPRSHGVLRGVGAEDQPTASRARNQKNGAVDTAFQPRFCV